MGEGNSNSYVFEGSWLNFVVVFFSLHNSLVCGEVMLITGMTTLRVVGDKVRIVTHETIIISMAPTF